mmetsp:Transcript_1878/g.4044  ORF Transcript_1878/g.4044 Transcript_1878/m.4044 type:complete len:370 (+) Transcript_1878:7550-8659(+)
MSRSIERLELPTRSLQRPSSVADLRSPTYKATLPSRFSPSSATLAQSVYSIASPRVSSRLTTRTADTYGYSSDFVNQLEKQHDSAMSTLYDKVRIQEDNHARVTESLHKQIAALREQVEISGQAHYKEVRRLKEDFETKLLEAIREKDSTEHNLRSRLQELSQALEGERSKASHYKHELIATKGSSTDEITKLQNQLRSLQAESERAKKLHFDSAKRDHETIERERQAARTEKETLIEEFKRQYDAQVTELKLRLESKDALLINLEQELNDARRQLSSRSESSARDLVTLQETLRSTRKVLEIQEQDLERLKRDREESRKESKLMSKEGAVLEHELALTRRENQELKGQNKRMQKIVYGRSPRKSVNKA